MIEQLERLIEQAVRAGADLNEIEVQIINPAPVDQDHQAALWLYAEALHARQNVSIPQLVLPTG